MKRFIAILSLLFVLFCGFSVNATVQVQLLDQTFTRGTGTPVQETSTFQSSNGQVLIQLYNGGQDPSADRVSSGVMKINGNMIFNQSQFNQKVSYLEKKITLSPGLNTLSVTLNSKPGGKIKIQIKQQVEAEAVGLIGPSGGTIEIKNPSSPLFGAKVVFPENALSSDTLISVGTTPFPSTLPSELTPVGSMLDLQPNGLKFAVDFTVTLPYSDINEDGREDTTNKKVNYLSVLYYNPIPDDFNRYQRMENVEVNRINKTISFMSNHFSCYGIYGFDVNPKVYYFIDWRGLNDQGQKDNFQKAIDHAISVWKPEVETKVTFINDTYSHTQDDKGIEEFQNAHCHMSEESCLTFKFDTITLSDGMSWIDTITLDDRQLGLKLEQHEIGIGNEYITVVATIAHELGHYLGLGHPFICTPYFCNAPSEYSDLMMDPASAKTRAVLEAFEVAPNADIVKFESIAIQKLLTIHDKYRIKDDYDIGFGFTIPYIERLKYNGKDEDQGFFYYKFSLWYLDPSVAEWWPFKKRSVVAHFDNVISDQIYAGVPSYCNEYSKFEITVPVPKNAMMYGVTMSVTPYRSSGELGNTLTHLFSDCFLSTPIINPIADHSVVQGVPYTGPTPSLLYPNNTPPVTWSLEEGPSGMTIDPNTGVTSWSNSPFSENTYTVKVTIKAKSSCDAYGVANWQLTVIPYNKTTIQLPQTGQTKCYNTGGTEIACAGTGQDGEIQAGVAWPEPRFTISGDCVTDNLTGLMWPRNGNLPNGPLTWKGALDYVAGINRSAGLCGHHDWRLPNILEQESVVHNGQTNVATWLNTQGFFNVQPSIYVSVRPTHLYFRNKPG